MSVNSVLGFAAVPSLPFGGSGESGFGRIHGDEGLRSFAAPQSVTVRRFAPPVELTSFGTPASRCAGPWPRPGPCRPGADGSAGPGDGNSADLDRRRSVLGAEWRGSGGAGQASVKDSPRAAFSSSSRGGAKRSPYAAVSSWARARNPAGPPA